MEYKSNHNIVYSCKYHVVWCPKYRRKVLESGIDDRLKELIEEICQENTPICIIDGIPITATTYGEVEGLPDYINGGLY